MKKINLDEALRQAVGAAHNGNLTFANECFNSILKVYPEQAVANYNLGKIAIELGRTKEAIPYLKAAISAKPKNKKYWHTYFAALKSSEDRESANIFLKSFPEKKISKGTKESLSRNLTEINCHDRNPAVSEVQSGIEMIASLYYQGKFKEAFASALPLLQQAPDNHLIWNILGSLQLELGKIK